MICLFLSIAIECPGLSLENGVVTYSTDTSPNFELGTIATHFCNTGLSLQGPVTRTCVNDDGIDIVGVWSGSPPTCSRTFFSSPITD